MMTIPAGSILNNRYRIVKLLGQGGFGAVYRAWDLTLKTPCAVKQNFETSPQAHKQFEKEALILARLRHPNLPRVIDHFTSPDQGQCLIMDFIEGEDLQEKLDRLGNTIPVDQSVAWIGQVCDALDYLHSQNPPVIHRDIKPANIKITPEGKAVLVDFGIAKVYDPQMKTTVGARAITQGYSPPEQYGRGSTDARTDIYALGATLYALLTGVEPPDSIDLVTRRRPPPVLSTALNPDVTPALQAAIARATQLDPDRRFAAVSDFKAALAARQQVITITDFSQPAQTQVAGYIDNGSQALPIPTASRFKLNHWALAIAGVIMVVLLLLFFFRPDENSEQTIARTQTALAVMQTQTAMGLSASATPAGSMMTATPSPEQEATTTPSPSPLPFTPALPTNTLSPTASFTPVTPGWPTSSTGDEACHLVIGMRVAAGSNARLWSSPDVTSASFTSLGIGQVLQVTDGPVWGRILFDSDSSGWWWRLTDDSSSLDGWIWEDRIQECTSQ